MVGVHDVRKSFRRVSGIYISIWNPLYIAAEITAVTQSDRDGSEANVLLIKYLIELFSPLHIDPSREVVGIPLNTSIPAMYRNRNSANSLSNTRRRDLESELLNHRMYYINALKQFVGTEIELWVNRILGNEYLYLSPLISNDDLLTILNQNIAEVQFDLANWHVMVNMLKKRSIGSHVLRLVMQDPALALKMLPDVGGALPIIKKSIQWKSNKIKSYDFENAAKKTERIVKLLGSFF
jgi:hypothetical protein